MLRLTEIEHELATETSQESQEHILNSAANILRHDIQSFAISVEKMPQSLLKCICWLIDVKAYKAASEPYTVPIDKIRKILGITESIVSLSKHTFTPFHLGLAVQLYHEFGSRGLVDNLNSHGSCLKMLAAE
jgi:predicted transcriptional regulator